MSVCSSWTRGAFLRPVGARLHSAPLILCLHGLPSGANHVRRSRRRLVTCSLVWKNRDALASASSVRSASSRQRSVAHRRHPPKVTTAPSATRAKPSHCQRRSAGKGRSLRSTTSLRTEMIAAAIRSIPTTEKTRATRPTPVGSHTERREWRLPMRRARSPLHVFSNSVCRTIGTVEYAAQMCDSHPPGVTIIPKTQTPVTRRLDGFSLQRFTWAVMVTLPLWARQQART